MKMPPIIDSVFLAPCGMNCMVCYKHCGTKKPCAGCLADDDRDKPEHCRKCRIKTCVMEKGIAYCCLCSVFPCKQLENFDKRYRQRYNASLVQNGIYCREHGISALMEQQQHRYTCPSCGGVISLHDGLCSICHTGTGT